MNTSATDRLTSSFYLRPSTSLLQYKKLFGKCKTPLQVYIFSNCSYYQFPEEKKWHLGFLLYFEHKIYFSRSFFELSNDPLNFQYSYHTFESDIVLHDCSNPYISIKRRTDKYPLKLATSFSGPVETPAVKSKNVSSSLEFLYFVLFFHSIKAAPGKDKGSEADETEPIETCGLSKLTFKDINVKFVSDSVAEKFKDNHLYLGIKCYPYTEYVKLTTGDDNSQSSKIVFL